MKNLFFLMMLLMLINCEKEGQIYDTIKKEEEVKKSDSLKSDSLQTKPVSKEESFKNSNTAVLKTLKLKHYKQFANFIHPDKGVRFSMYAFVNPAKDKLFTKEEFVKYIDSETKFTWGERDGTGEPLVLSIKDYLQKWVFKKDFTTAQYYFNDFKASGNSLNNLKELYPNANFTENFIAGSEQNSGLDWASLRLVFEETNGNNYLVAVINDEWTI